MQIELINFVFSYRGEDIFILPIRSSGTNVSGRLAEVKIFLAKLMETSEDEIEMFC